MVNRTSLLTRAEADPIRKYLALRLKIGRLRQSLAERFSILTHIDDGATTTKCNEHLAAVGKALIMSAGANTEACGRHGTEQRTMIETQTAHS